MKREELKELGIDDETVNKVMEKYGASVQTIKSENDQLKTEKTTLEAEKAALDKNIADYETQLTQLKEGARNHIFIARFC